MDPELASRTGGAAQTLFVRNATGLVRDISMRGATLMSLAYMSVPFGAFVATQAPFAFPGSNLVLLSVLAAIASISVAVLWGSLSQAMPRSGGDYLFVSRTLSPVLGYVGSFNLLAWGLIVLASLAATIGPYTVGGALAATGIATGSRHLLQIATTISGKSWQFGIGAAVLILVLGLLSLRGTLWIRIFTVAFFVSLVGLGVTVLVIAVHGRSDFQHSLPGFGTSYGGILRDARAAGYSDGGFSLSNTFAAGPIALGFYAFMYISAYAGGEIRRANKIMVRSMLWALGLGAIFLTMLLFFSARTFGQDFLGSATYLFTLAPDKYPIPAAPNVFLFGSLLTKNAPTIWIINLSYALGTIVTLLPAFLAITRVLFAWAFDRVLPAKLADVNARTHSPLVANAICLILALIFLAFIVYGPQKFLSWTFTSLLGQLPSFALVALAGVMLPWRRPDIYAETPLRERKLFGFPSISVVGILALAVYVWFAIPLAFNSTLGANNRQGLTAMVVIPILGLLVYLASRSVNQRRGVDLSVSFREIPPE